jgi:aminopeptidase N
MPRLRTASIAVSSALVLLAGALPAVGAVASHHSSTIGARGAGDPYFPNQGNGGYNVSHYGLYVRYRTSDHALRGNATIVARATQTLTRFDLDLRRTLKVSAVQVNGVKAIARQPAAKTQELVITPKHALLEGHRFTVRVSYAGVAKPVTDPDGSLDGWIPTNDGAFVAGEPQGAPTWFPVNDTPRDKATYTVSVNVPQGLTAVGNGALQSRVVKAGRTTWTWKLTTPISSYLVTASIGKFHVTRGTTPKGVPYFIAVDPSQLAKSRTVLRKLPGIVDFFSSKYGKYPFHQAGAIVDNAPNVGYALETATRPLFDSAPSEATLAHELAHQWYGDTVTLKRWRDIWLNEGFAEFSSWLWQEHSGGKTAATYLRELLANPAGSEIWSPPPANPRTSDQIFSDSVYERGAGTLEALREKIGSPTFFRIMRGWLAAHRYHNATDAQFVRYASKIAHRDLQHFFYRWLYRSGKP